MFSTMSLQSPFTSLSLNKPQDTSSKTRVGAQAECMKLPYMLHYPRRCWFKPWPLHLGSSSLLKHWKNSGRPCTLVADQQKAPGSWYWVSPAPALQKVNQPMKDPSASTLPFLYSAFRGNIYIYFKYEQQCLLETQMTEQVTCMILCMVYNYQQLFLPLHMTGPL